MDVDYTISTMELLFSPRVVLVSLTPRVRCIVKVIIVKVRGAVEARCFTPGVDQHGARKHHTRTPWPTWSRRKLVSVNTVQL